MPTDAAWHPNELLRIEGVRPTSMRVVLAVTDAGRAYVKPLGGSDAGPHGLACEWLGTRLAAWLGLPTLEFSLLRLSELDAEMINSQGGRASAGHAFASRSVDHAFPWSGEEKALRTLVNACDIPLIPVLDTWLLNWDRCPPTRDPRRRNHDNVLLTPADGKRGALRLVPIDHGECLAMAGELSERIGQIGRMKDKRVFGLFPAFEPYVNRQALGRAVERLGKMTRATARGFVEEIPDDWEVNARARGALVEFICRRAAFLTIEIVDMFRVRMGDLFF